MSISSCLKRQFTDQPDPYDESQVWFREFTNRAGEVVLFQLYSGSGGFTYPNRQLLGRLFGEVHPKGYWVNRESFDSSLKRKGLRSAGKLKANAWTVSALVCPKTRDGRDVSEGLLTTTEKELIACIPIAREHIISTILEQPGLEHTHFNFVRVNLEDTSLPYHESQLAALGFFATNYVDESAITVAEQKEPLSPVYHRATYHHIEVQHTGTR
mmetsp:Transcript_9077/g.13652  ORF Transcript_9077/g.13652 Transcript_9077/m.13652 type:complete len:213 (-) Transcript_9077:154-792(-)|eukprot:CAMPEP_0185026820 /NCGR_PEP_ID=MMETSP1103-20130426/11318_1 /TAXON_ID=36769 /ORGANISM="Paraphysomonas bandaiensis, Strain Caron Lab Isolate" /LENGTH=212 /DNA_ID=CAMNT_0027560533 /DNA_START=123 /DNA_END=761 /DNA_ORIENTATION=+